jgi:signal transduction histidine kinase
VDATAAAGAGAPDLGNARGREGSALAAIRVLGAAVIVFVMITSFRARPAPGGHGAALVSAVALVVLCAAIVTAMWMRPAGIAVRLAVLLTAVVSAAVLIGVQGNSAAFLGVFPAVCIAALSLPASLSVLVAVAAASAVSAAWLADGRALVTGIILNDFAILAFFVLSLFARRLRESNQRAEVLLAELEQTRAAHAQAAALAERQRLAREVHDVLAHTLSGLVLNLETARLLAGHSAVDRPVADAIERAHRLAKAGLTEARRAIGMLHDDALPGPERLADLAAGFEDDTGVPCHVTVTGSERNLGSDGRLTLYRVTQEALTNARKHARPRRVEIMLAYEPAGTMLSIEDFSISGKDTPPSDETGYGLTGMRERAELLGGTLTAGPTGSGFAVRLWVPG